MAPGHRSGRAWAALERSVTAEAPALRCRGAPDVNSTGRLERPYTTIRSFLVFLQGLSSSAALRDAKTRSWGGMGSASAATPARRLGPREKQRVFRLGGCQRDRGGHGAGALPAGSPQCAKRTPRPRQDRPQRARPVAGGARRPWAVWPRPRAKGSMPRRGIPGIIQRTLEIVPKWCYIVMARWTGPCRSNAHAWVVQRRPAGPPSAAEPAAARQRWRTLETWPSVNRTCLH